MKTYIQFIAMVVAYLLLVFGFTTHNVVETLRLTTIIFSILFGSIILSVVNVWAMMKVTHC